jgi:CBS domain-containing protein
MEPKNRLDKQMYGFVGCTAKQFMTRTVITVSRQTTMRELAALFEEHDFNAFPVMEDGEMVGIISKFDFLRAFAFTTTQVVPHYNELMSRPAAEVMTEARSPYRPDIATNTSSSADGEPQEPKFPSGER